MKNVFCFILYLFIINNVVSQEFKKGKAFDYLARSDYKLVATTDVYSISFSPRNRPINLYPNINLIFDVSSFNYERWFRLIKHDLLSMKATVHKFSTIPGSSIVTNYATSESFIAISRKSGKSSESFYVDLINHKSMSHEIVGKEIVRFNSAEKHKLLYIEKKGDSEFELLLKNIPLYDEELIYQYFILDKDLKVIAHQEIPINNQYKNCSIDIRKVNTETVLLLNNFGFFHKDEDIKKSLCALLVIYREDNELIEYENPEGKKIYASKIFGSEDSDDIISLVLDENTRQIKGLNILNLIDLKNYEINFPTGLIQSLSSKFTWEIGLTEYYFEKIDHNIFLIQPFKISYNLYSSNIQVKMNYGVPLVFKVIDEEIDWLEILEPKVGEKLRIKSFANPINTTKDIYLLYTNKYDVVMSRFDKETGNSEVIESDEINPHKYNFVTYNKNFNSSDPYLVFIQNYDPITRAGGFSSKSVMPIKINF